MKRIIITGATGFVGANLARRLLQDGHQLHLLVRPGYKGWRIEEIQKQVKLHQISLEDKEGLARTVSAIRPEWIFHLAAYGAYPAQANIQQMVQANIIGTINLLEACLGRGFAAFVNTGSSSEYGFKGHAPAEDELLEPNSAYAATKASSTLFCRYFAEKQKAYIPTLRLYSVYGLYEEPSRLMPRLILQGLEGRFPPLVKPEIARDYIYVEDVSEAYILAASQPVKEYGPVYNVGTGIQTTLATVVEVAKKVLRISAEPLWGSMPPRSWDTHTWLADKRKIQEKLGWQAKYSLEEGFSKMADWFKNNPALLDFYRSHNNT